MPKAVKQTMQRTSKTSTSCENAWDTSAGVKINLYGRSGTGKTTLWSSFPKPILAIVCSGGQRPGELKSIDTPENRKVITPVVIRQSRDVAELAEGAGKYKTIVLDHATGLQDLVIKEVLGLEKVPVQLAWGLATQQQYGQVALQVKELLRCLLSLEQNVVIVAQEREFNTDSGSDVLMPYVASALTPSIVGWLNPAVDYICQTFIQPRMVEKEQTIGKEKTKLKLRGKGVDYRLRTAPHDVYTTKFRLPLGSELPDDILNPTYDKLMNLIKQGG